MSRVLNLNKEVLRDLDNFKERSEKNLLESKSKATLTGKETKKLDKLIKEYIESLDQVIVSRYKGIYSLNNEEIELLKESIISGNKESICSFLTDRNKQLREKYGIGEDWHECLSSVDKDYIIRITDFYDELLRDEDLTEYERLMIKAKRDMEEIIVHEYKLGVR